MEGRGYISAFSDNLPEDMSFTQFVYSLPTSVSFDGFESLFEMKTISLDMILAALEGALEEMVGINKDVYVDQANTNNVYEQRYLETAVTAQYTKANGATASDTLEDYSDYYQDFLDTSFYIDDNQTIRSVGTWVNSTDDSRYLGYVDADELHLFDAALATTGTDFLLGYVLNNPTGDTAKTKSVLNRQGQNVVLSRYQIGSDSLWGFEEVDDNGQTQLHAMEQHWYNTTSWSDNDGAFSASETLIADQALYSGSDSLANRTLVLGTLQTGAMYQEVDLIDMSVADVLGDGATDFVGTLYKAIKDTRGVFE